jgi:transcriptional regulator with XRE-family HTH domain
MVPSLFFFALGRKETSGNEWKPEETTMQINDIQAAPRDVDIKLIQQCKNARQALALCVRLSELTDEEVAGRLGISKGYLSKILNGRAQLDGDRRIKLMRICTNRAPLQYEAWAMGANLSGRSPEDILREAVALLSARGGASA